MKPHTGNVTVRHFDFTEYLKARSPILAYYPPALPLPRVPFEYFEYIRPTGVLALEAEEKRKFFLLRKGKRVRLFLENIFFDNFPSFYRLSESSNLEAFHFTYTFEHIRIPIKINKLESNLTTFPRVSLESHLWKLFQKISRCYP